MDNNITVCYGKNCRKKNSEAILDAIQDRINHPECPITALLELNVNVKLCNKFCQEGPWVNFNSDIYLNMNIDKAKVLIKAIEKNDQETLMTLNPIHDEEAKSG